MGRHCWATDTHTFWLATPGQIQSLVRPFFFGDGLTSTLICHFGLDPVGGQTVLLVDGRTPSSVCHFHPDPDNNQTACPVGCQTTTLVRRARLDLDGLSLDDIQADHHASVVLHGFTRLHGFTVLYGSTRLHGFTQSHGSVDSHASKHHHGSAHRHQSTGNRMVSDADYIQSVASVDVPLAPISDITFSSSAAPS